jgi:hypothetical protein
MKRLLLSLLTALALIGTAGVSRAEDRIAGFRYVDEVGDPAQGEVKRTKAFNLSGELVGVTTTYKSGKVRNERYENGVLRFVHETDFKGWSRDIEKDKNGVLVTETIREKSGKSIVFVNVDALSSKLAKLINVAVGDQLHLVYTMEPWPGSRSDTVTKKPKGTLNHLTANPTLPSGSKLVSTASFLSVAKGDDELVVDTTLVTAGTPGPHGKPPSSQKKRAVIKVQVK